MPNVNFHPISLSDKNDIRSAVSQTECRNCDLNFMNLMSWRFLYDTETAHHEGWQLFRFKSNGHLAYLMPVGKGDLHHIVPTLMEDAEQQGAPFLMLGVCENNLALLDEAMPGYFYATADRDFTDYIYHREVLATLSGKNSSPNVTTATNLRRPTHISPTKRSRLTSLKNAWRSKSNGRKTKPTTTRRKCATR